ncbi:uncharacterized protein LOC141646839 isoform X2 [Silene latifolia]|uniref:uncharacterized protein LOC141646839 isoform X2 n=1 Tax=Silene latifolia TaxID=37657 RepID=UPI003D77D96C
MKLLMVSVMKEKRWVVFKGEQEPTSVPVEWICWLNGQRKRAPTAEEMAEMEARREQVRQNVARLKKEEEERRAVQGTIHRQKIPGKASGPDLQSFLQQVRSEDDDHDETSVAAGSTSEAESKNEKTVQPQEAVEPQTTEPTGSGSSFQPGVWKPPS